MRDSSKEGAAVSIVDILDGYAEAHPEKPLYCFLDSRGQETERYSYRGFVDRTHALARHLTDDLGHAPGERVLLAYPPGLEMIAAFFACARAGIVPVPVPPVDARGAGAAIYRIDHLAKDCGANAVLTTQAGLESARRAAEEDEIGGLPWTVTDTHRPSHVDPVEATPGEILFLQYTSGSTSRPKGVKVTHANILHNRQLVVDHDAPIAVTWLPQHHDMGLIGYYLYIALSGGTTYGFSPATFVQRPLLWLEAITRYQATASSAPNFAFDYCLRTRLTKDRLARLDLSSLRFLMAAAEPIKPDTYSRFLQTFRPQGLKPDAFFVAYGLAENTLAVTNYGRRTLSVGKRDLARNKVRVTESASGIAGAIHLMSCGKPLGDSRIEIVDPDSRSPLPPGRVGEIWVSGPSKCAGYWDNAAATTATFDARLNGGSNDTATDFLRTGDLGFLHEDELYVCGRCKDLIIVRGQNIFPQDIESVAERAVEAIRTASAAAFEVDLDGETGVALVAETGTKVAADPVEVVRAVRAALGIELSAVQFVAPREVPKTSSGKVMRFEARRRYLEDDYKVVADYRRDPAEAESTDDSRPFAQLLARYQLTGTEDQTLLDLGVDSLDLVLFMHELQEMLADKGGEAIADQVDVRLVQQMSVRDIVGVAEMFLNAPEDAILQVRERLADVRAAQRTREARQMAEDTRLTFSPAVTDAKAPAVPRTVMLTGATGFLGPFLLISLLDQTPADVICLVRASSAEEGMARLRSAVRLSGLEHRLDAQFDARVRVLCGDLDKPCLGMSPADWDRLTHQVDALYHNGALVNYLFDYARMRNANVLGTNEVLRFAFEGQRKAFNHVSTTFIFGWATKPVLLESDGNEEMALLDFGYSQSKWVSERLVVEASKLGLDTRTFRPALITPSVDGQGNNFDITIRLLAFMIKHGIGVGAQNQVSFMPADVTANNIVAIANQPDTAGGTFHVTRDDYAKMSDITDLITQQTGRHFDHYDLPDFVPEVIRRCTRDDLLFPLLDFLIGSVDNISSMEFKRYDSSIYQAARNASPHGQPDPSLEDTVAGILRFMERKDIL